LTYSLVDAPSGAAINSTSGIFSWTPTESQGPGGFNFTVRVSDGNLTADQPVAVTVNEVNVAPVLAAIPPQTVNKGVLLTFNASATDADLPANTLTYLLLGAPGGASIAASSGVFSWTPGETQSPGSFNFTVQVSDGNLTHEQSVSITVASPFPSPNVDTDADGLSDMLEYAFLTDPGIPNGNPFRVLGNNAGTLTLAFPWRWQAAGLSWQIRHGQNLSNLAAWPVVAPGTTTVTREGDIDRITIAPTMVHPSRGFYVLEVIGN
jgi:Putative Ig domain